MPAPTSAFCPHCGQRAPITLSGVKARCTACGGTRLPFSSTTLNFTGKPSRIGGVAAKFFGGGILVVGSSVALGLGLLIQTIFPGGYAGLAVALPIGIITLATGLALILGGRHLSKSGDQALQGARVEAIRGLAANHRGDVTAQMVAASLQVGEAEADALLVAMAKDPDDFISLDVDDDGTVHYLFGERAQALRIDARLARIAEQGGDEQQAIDEAALAEQEAAARRRGSR